LTGAFVAGAATEPESAALADATGELLSDADSVLGDEALCGAFALGGEAATAREVWLGCAAALGEAVACAG